MVGSLILLCLAIIFIPPFYDGRNPFDLEADLAVEKMPHAPRFPETSDMAKQVSNTGSGRLHEIEKRVKANMPESARSDSQLAEKENGISQSFEDFNAGEMTTRLLSDLAENSKLVSRFSKDKPLKQAWAVQVGSFHEAHRAQALRDELISNDFQAFIKTVLKDGVSISRVFAGVSLDKSIAEDIKSNLENLADYDAIIVPYQP